MASVSFLAGPVTRTWRVGARLVPVQLYHNTITGERWLSVDGLEQPGTVGSNVPLLSPAAVLNFEAAGEKGYVTINTQGSRFIHRCYFGPGMSEVPEDNSLAATSSGADNEAGKLKVTIDAAETAADSGAKQAVWFKVHTVRERDRAETIVHRRFNNFVALDEAVRSAYKGSAVIDQLPALPPRGIGLFQNQSDPAFIEKRRWLLQDYLYKLESIPRMRTNSDFTTFLGIVDAARESSVLFPAGPLGLTLVENGSEGLVEVQAMRPTAEGQPSPAMAAGVVSVGDKVRTRVLLFMAWHVCMHHRYYAVVDHWHTEALLVLWSRIVIMPG